MDRIILLSDLNSFYASVECLHNPSIKDKPVAVCGSVEDRHGIVLAANRIAKGFAIRTGDAVWQAKQKCPELHVVEPNMERYVSASKAANRIYLEYSPIVEPFGLDENYIDLTGTGHLHGDGMTAADEIRGRVKRELGLTVSVGVSFNRTFAKLASDMRKPDAVTGITRDDFKERIWPLPVSELLFVGRATGRKLGEIGIRTIGQLAGANPENLRRRYGVNGEMIWRFANGLDDTPVSPDGWRPEIKSIGNSTTTPKDLATPGDIRIITTLLSESVAERMMEKSFKCQTVQVWIRYNDMASFQHQKGLSFPTRTAQRICQAALELIFANRRPDVPIRSLGVRACKLMIDDTPQLSFFPEQAADDKRERVEKTVWELRKRFGHFVIERGSMLTDKRLSGLDTQNEASAQSVAFYRGTKGEASPQGG